MRFLCRFNAPAFFLACALIAISLGTARPAAAEEVSPGMKQTIEDIVRDYIDENPQILVDAINKLRKRDAQRRQQQGKANLEDLRDDLENNKNSPTIGNLKGSITVVEFFDYRCPFCKRMMPVIDKLIAEDADIRFVYKEFPILGPTSTYASRAALAVWKMDKKKYIPFHHAVLGARGDLTEERVLTFAEDIGIDSDDLEKRMKDPEIEAEIRRNIKMAGALGITGTPSYIIGNRIIPGAVSYEDLKDVVMDTKKKK